MIHELIYAGAEAHPTAPALIYKESTLSYADLAGQLTAAVKAYRVFGLNSIDRVAVYLEKRFETVIAQFGAATAGAIFVPVNPVLKARQVAHILRKSGARFLVTTRARLDSLGSVIEDCPNLKTIVVIDEKEESAETASPVLVSWHEFLGEGELARVQPVHVIDQNAAAILFTSGSTGSPKGVVISQRNLIAAARSASKHLFNSADDRILCVLPFSFDYGLVQLTSAFNVGASVVLMNYLFPRDVIQAVVKERITGLAGVPPLWIQLAQQEWPAEATQMLRYVTNSGGALPVATQNKLREALPRTDFYLMYGLTESFRSTSLPPSEIARRPTSIGKPIPNADIMIVRANGTPCDPNEQGELIHRGSFVTQGYWNDPEKTSEIFRPVPNQPSSLTIPEIAVWSGDIAWYDEEGFYYFLGRRDAQIKTSGYRVSPTEIEEMIYETDLAAEAVAFGVPHPELGQAPVAIVTPRAGEHVDIEQLLERLGAELPRYMVPSLIVERPSIPRTPNGKMDRRKLTDEFADVFQARDETQAPPVRSADLLDAGEGRGQ